LLALAFAAALAHEIAAAKDLDLAIVEDCRPEFAIDTDVFLGPVVQSDSRTRRTLVDSTHTVEKRHHHDAICIAGIFRPGRTPGGGCERLALSPGEVCHQVKVMHCTFDHQWIEHGVTEQS